MSRAGSEKSCFVDSLRPVIYSCENSTSKMDYLSWLPIEIWREILLFDTPFMDIEEMDYSSFQADMAVKVNRRLREIQSRRHQLLTICKSLYPLVESLLYSSVILPRDRETRQFMAALETKQRRGECPSIYIQVFSISIEHFPSYGSLELLEYHHTNVAVDITSTFVWPNLKHLFLKGPQLIYGYSFETPLRNRTKKLSDPTYLDENVLARFSARAPNVKHLSVVNYLQAGDQTQMPEFPSLLSLDFDMGLNPTNMPHLSCPSLVALSLKITCSEGLLSGIRQYASTIEELKVTLSSHLFTPSSEIILPNEIFSQCQKLKKLTLDIFHIELPQPFPDMLYAKIKTLVLFFRLPMDSEELVGRLNFFSKKRFTNLSSITIKVIFDDPVDLDSLRLVLSEIFPQIDCVVDVLRS